MDARHLCISHAPGPALYPAIDALHLVYGDTGGTCPWENPTNHRPALSAHLGSTAGITQGKKTLYRGLLDLIEGHHPAAAFVYPTGRGDGLGEEVDAVCSKVEKEKGIPVIAVHSEGPNGVKKSPCRVSCEALFRLMGTGNTEGISPASVNILGGEHNKGAIGEWVRYCHALGVEVVSVLPADCEVADIRRSHGAALNVVISEGNLLQLALMMEIEYGIPFFHVSGDGAGIPVEAFAAVKNGCVHRTSSR
ncbi:nitrogenase component 1 [Desulfoluna sp.]|uniref:nitrogenase component 1 n=1 Tax=Desulfoluna sp. TaxID=2045199 RepID=UPI0026368786|nr:nitrogenase component 1 [Desulfoluna sp.]